MCAEMKSLCHLSSELGEKRRWAGARSMVTPGQQVRAGAVLANQVVTV